MANVYPKKRFVYRCKCNKDPMRGTIRADPASERAAFESLDLAWVEIHNRPGCTLAHKSIDLVPQKAKRQ